MISSRDRLVNQLMGTITKDLRDTSVLRVNMDNAVNILNKHGYILPVKLFESKLEEVLNKAVVGRAAVQHSTISGMAEIIVNLATKMSVSSDDIIKHIMKDLDTPDEGIWTNDIDDWRQEKYGKMPWMDLLPLLLKLKNTVDPEMIEKLLSYRTPQERDHFERSLRFDG